MSKRAVAVMSTRMRTDELRPLHVPAALLAAFIAVWTALAIAPVSRADWLLENLLVFVSVPLFVATYRRMRFSNAAYYCLFVFLTLHVAGAHYTYSLVPYDEWIRTLTGESLQTALGFTRNHFDRLVHFLYGLLVLLPSIELLERYVSLRSVWRWIVPVLFVTSHSVIYEIVEMIAALIVAPELGDAYLGTQGDPWDAQKDMALALLGAVTTTLLVAMVDARRRAQD